MRPIGRSHKGAALAAAAAAVRPEVALTFAQTSFAFAFAFALTFTAAAAADQATESALSVAARRVAMQTGSGAQIRESHQRALRTINLCRARCLSAPALRDAQRAQSIVTATRASLRCAT